MSPQPQRVVSPSKSHTDVPNSAESRVKVEAATQLRDNLDVFTNPPSYPVFLKRVMPIFINILNGPCIFQSNSNEQVLETHGLPALAIS